MPRYQKLIRLILEYVEEHGTGRPLAPPEFDEYTRTEINYHIGLCDQAGYLEVRKTSGNHPRYRPVSLTWNGHEQLKRGRADS